MCDLEAIVLTYNRASKLPVMLESLCRQTLRDFDIKVLDNASTDKTREVVKSFQRAYPKRRIIYERNPTNLGNVGNFKRSQEVASHRFTAIFHDDDAIHPRYLEFALSHLQLDSSVVCVSGGYDYYYNVDCRNFPILERSYYVYSPDDCVCCNTMVVRPTFFLCVYRTDAYKAVVYNDELYGKLHDNVFLVEMNKLGKLVYLTGRCGRWGLSNSQDSEDFSTGPFVHEIVNILCRLKALNDRGGFSFTVSLYNLSYFYYTWSHLDRQIDWNGFKILMVNSGIFTKFQLWLFSSQRVMNIANKHLLKATKRLLSRIYHP